MSDTRRWSALLAVIAVLSVAVAAIWTSRDSPAAQPPILEPDPILTGAERAGSASWTSGIGLPDAGRPGEADTRFGLRLTAPRRGSVGATFYGVAGLTTLGEELGFDYQNDGTCTKSSPAIVVTWTGGQTDSYGCATGDREPAPQDPDRWTRVTFDPNLPGTLGNPPPISDIRIVFNVPLKTVVIDNFRLITWVVGWPGLSIYVADKGNNRIVRIDNWTASGWVANWSSFGTAGAGIGEFNAPHDVAVDAEGRIYIADTGNHRIVRVDNMSGAGWTTLGTGTCSAMAGAFCGPESVSVDGAGRIYVAESYNTFPLGPPRFRTDRIVRVDDMSGAGWTTFGTPGAGAGQFTGPVAIRYDAAFRLYVADLFNRRIARIDDMSGAGWQTLSSGSCIPPWPSFPDDLGQVSYLAFDLSQRLYVLNTGSLLRFNDISSSACVKAPAIWDPARQIYEWGGDGVGVDSAYRIYTTDGHPLGAHRIRRMRDMTGAGWITYGSRGSGVGQFIEPEGIAVVGAEPSPFLGR